MNARHLGVVRQPAGSKHYQSGLGSADWLLRELQLRRACERNDAPKPIMLINGGVQERRRGETERECEGHACLSLRKTKKKGKKSMDQPKANLTMRDR